MMQPSLIDVDDTYVIDGEGQPAILALCAQVRQEGSVAVVVVVVW